MRIIYRLTIVTVIVSTTLAAIAQQPNPSVPSLVSQPQQPSQGNPQDGENNISMSFDKAEISGVLKFLSTASGVPIVWDSDIKGSVTIICLKPLPLKDAFEVINSALRVRGYSMVGNLDSKIIRVVPLKKAIADKVQVQTGGDPDMITPADSIVTQVIQLDYINAGKLKDEIKPLISEDQASIMAISSINAIIVTDSAGNVHRVAQIIKELDKDTSDIIEVEVYTCQHSSAASMVDTLTKVFKIEKDTPAAPPSPGRPPEGGPQQQQVKSEDELISLKGSIRIAADERINAIIISASRPKIDLVLSVVKKLDIDTEPEVTAKIFPLQYADAKIVSDQLNKVFEQPEGSQEARPRYPWEYGGSQPSQDTGYAGLKRNVVVADVRTNSVIVTATDQNMKSFESMIKQLDAPKVLSEVTRAFPLKYAKAADLAETLNRLFRGEYRRQYSFYDYYFGQSTQQEEGSPLDQLKSITVVPETKTNTLLITGPPQVFSTIEGLIESLDKRTAQVFIEVVIVDVTLDNDTRFGVEWNWKSTSTLPDGTPKQSAETDFGLAKIGGGLTYTVISENLKAVLRALESRSNVRVYSTPTITTADNVEALVSIGRDEPFISSEQETISGNFRRTVDFKKVAVALRVTPHVNEASDVIAMDVHQTINEIIGREPILGAPIIADREAKTSISVKDGQTIVIGGIIKNNRERITRAVPIISRIPLIGELFKSREWRDSKSELMVFLTPHVLRDDQSVTEITDVAKERLSDSPPIIQEY